MATHPLIPPGRGGIKLRLHAENEPKKTPASVSFAPYRATSKIQRVPVLERVLHLLAGKAAIAEKTRLTGIFTPILRRCPTKTLDLDRQRPFEPIHLAILQRQGLGLAIHPLLAQFLANAQAALSPLHPGSNKACGETHVTLQPLLRQTVEHPVQRAPVAGTATQFVAQLAAAVLATRQQPDRHLV